MIDQIRSDDPIRRKIETLGTTLSLPTVRKALGILEGAHASNKRFGADDVVDIHAYEGRRGETHRLEDQCPSGTSNGGAA